MRRNPQVVDGQVVDRRFMRYSDVTQIGPTPGRGPTPMGPNPSGAGAAYVPPVNQPNPFTTIPPATDPTVTDPGTYTAPGYTDPGSNIVVDPGAYIIDVPDGCDPRVRSVVLFVEIPLLALIAIHPQVPGLLRLGAGLLAAWDAVQMTREPSVIGP